eukprot:GHUV01018658.1.p1 GENE.GHUV01018658.1~~GHUV01018658.1.p1  ORF type:complete len:128 (-),score=11.90 GHUV01018658.1:298-681(-)
MLTYRIIVVLGLEEGDLSPASRDAWPDQHSQVATRSLGRMISEEQDHYTQITLARLPTTPSKSDQPVPTALPMTSLSLRLLRHHHNNRPDSVVYYPDIDNIVHCMCCRVLLFSFTSAQLGTSTWVQL